MERIDPDVVVIQHEDDAPMGALEGALGRAPLRVHLVQAHRGEPLPGDLRTVDGLVVLGGGVGATDDDRAPWLPRTRDLLREAADREIPTLGICLGAQLLAVALEGTLRRRDIPEIGLHEVTLTEKAAQDPVLSALSPDGSPVTVPQFHQDEVDRLPPGATVLARGGGAIQAFRVGPAQWGVQFHPEVDDRIMERWATTSSLTPAGRRPEEFAQQIRDAGEAAQAWVALLEAWTRQVAPRRRE
ncbi:type 1 glutamine amidotransferase [Brachybacterium sp. EF45031]|uniref:type 1 glutamine amidotransferase n=1 Tax=Brachybacterium sillae TaxID=2810536 RepID=UPI00217E5AA6|nr:type 1 glutamine amidotransferase [Brachybacterium sillae]MCS6712561.1 type 1 glutamine amidotransferase [Brachybacterium sillae]